MILEYERKIFGKKKPTDCVGIIVVAAIMVRVIVGILHPFWFPDSEDYNFLGAGILHSGVYEVHGMVASRMPGYPLFVAGIYSVAREAVSSVVVAQALLGGVGVWLVYLIGRRVGECVGILGALLAAVDPLSVGFSAAFLSEGVFTVLMLGAIWGLVRVMESRNGWWWVLVGVMWGVAVYMRASAAVVCGAACGVGVFDDGWAGVGGGAGGGGDCVFEFGALGGEELWEFSFGIFSFDDAGGDFAL